jgi:hypothetical protein
MFRKEVSHYGKIVKMCQFYSDSSVFFLQPTVHILLKQFSGTRSTSSRSTSRLLEDNVTAGILISLKNRLMA